ncbi:hypothetical protein [Acetobacter aceti]|uniref:hypothetical protein n=1 Tax=Acetobacter aceti TaxID=435 RepID=UPI002F96903D
MAGCGLNTLKRALSVLREGNWIEVRQIGPTGTACAYVVNDRVAWSETATASVTACFLLLCCSQTMNNPIRMKLAYSRLYTPFQTYIRERSSYQPVPAYHHRLNLPSTAWNRTYLPPKNSSANVQAHVVRRATYKRALTEVTRSTHGRSPRLPSDAGPVPDGRPDTP